MSEKPFRAVIVGGGITGLALSHSFQLANIDHVVLEKHAEIVSYAGAAIMLWPHTCRVLDQFGLLEKMNAACIGLKKDVRRRPDGTVYWVNTAAHDIEKV
jgi:FAD dependent monooxygenase